MFEWLQLLLRQLYGIVYKNQVLVSLLSLFIIKYWDDTSVGVDEFMPAICWTRSFLKAQGYDVQDNISFKDNKISILLEKNGKASSSKRTKHINIQFSFITDRAHKEGVLQGT
jgi:hypothetical protein